MSRKNFITLVLGVVGVLLFGIGMCMCLLPEGGMFKPGVAIAAVGAIALLVLLVRRRMDGKPGIKLNLKTIGIVLYSLCSVLVLGTGMCLIMVWEKMVFGILIGVVGIVLLLFLIPMVVGLKD